MALKASTGLRNYMLDDQSLKDALALGKLYIYSGSAPVDADAVSTGNLLVTITVASGATGLSLGSASLGAIAKAAEVWSGVVSGAGTQTAGYWRFAAAADSPDTASTTLKRLQGTCGTAAADLVMTSTSLANGATQTIDYFSIALPA
jgi:hypothetical protein